MAQATRGCDAFVFPSIREPGAGVAIEAMASGLPCIVANYGAPANLAAEGRGIPIPLGTRDEMVIACRREMETLCQRQENIPGLVTRAQSYAGDHYEWSRKAEYTVEIYRAVLERRPLGDFRAYG